MLGQLCGNVESGFAALPDDARRLKAFRLNSGGWDEQVENIDAYLGSSAS